MAPSARFPYAPPVRTLRPYPPPGEYPPPVTLPGGVDRVAPADKRQCVCCNESMVGGSSHACMNCDAVLHGADMCSKQWMPKDGHYFCSQACIQVYNGREDALAERVPLRSRPTSAEVVPVAAPIAPALQPQPGAPSNVNLNPVPSARTLRPYSPPVASTRTLHPCPLPVPSAHARTFPPVSPPFLRRRRRRTTSYGGRHSLSPSAQ